MKKIFSKSGREYERIAWRKCTLEHFSEFQRRLNDAVMEVNDTSSNTDDIDHYYSLLCQCVKSDECLPCVKYKQFLKPYWNNQLEQLKSTCMEYHRRWCLEGRPRGEQFESFQLYKNAKCLFIKEQRRLIRKSQENDFKELSDATEIDNIKFWKYVNRRRNRRTMTNVFTFDDGRNTSQPYKIAGLWANYSGPARSFGYLGILSILFEVLYTVSEQSLRVFGILFRLQFLIFGIPQISEKHYEYFKNTLDFDFHNICNFTL